MQELVRRALQHAQDGGLCPHGEELEDGEHASGGGVVAVQEAQGVADRVPHALDRSPRAAFGDEPVREGHVIQVADVLQCSMTMGQTDS